MKKSLVAYFSATGITRGAAYALAEITGSDIHEIKPEVPYTMADLNWTNTRSRSSIEMVDMSSRPAISEESKCDLLGYDVIYLCFPIWWYVAPHIINTFLEEHDLTGKTIVVFATSGGSEFGRTVERLEGSAGTAARITEGLILNGKTEEDIIQCLEGLNI